MPQGELSTRLIVLDALNQGKEVYVPYTYKSASVVKGVPSSVMDMVSLHSQADYDSLETDPWGIPTPAEASLTMRKKCLDFSGPQPLAGDGSSNALQNLEIIMIPGMAFDRRFARLGHGKGYYDCFLTRYHEKAAADAHKSKMPFLGA